MSYSVFNSDTVKDIAESLGIAALDDDVARALAMDVEYRIHEIVQEASQFMRHSKRTILTCHDIDDAFQSMNLEPIYGFASERPICFKEAFYSPSQPPIYFLHDEELDFDKIINRPLPKVPRQVNYTSHWLAIEGTQPQIPQNIAQIPKQDGDALRNSADLYLNISSNQSQVKPLVKHALSKELMLYFEKVTSIIFEESNESLRAAALLSLRKDPGLHQLLPYFISFIFEKVTHQLRNASVLNMALQMIDSLIGNKHHFIEPYVHQLIPPILTCLVARKVGSADEIQESYLVRAYAANILQMICKKFGDTYQTLKPRIVRTLLKCFLDKNKPFVTQYGAIKGLEYMGAEVVKVLLLPNSKLYSNHIMEQKIANPQQEMEMQKNIQAIVEALELLREKTLLEQLSHKSDEEIKKLITEMLGTIVSEALIEKNDMELMRSIASFQLELIGR